MARMQFVEAKLPAALGLEFAHGRHDFPGDCVVKLRAILRRVIEPAEPAEGVIAVIFEPGVPGDLLAEFDEPVENFVEIVHLLQTPSGHQFPGFLAQRAVGFFQVAAHLDERLFLAAKVHRERAGQFLVLLTELGVLGFERHVFRPEQLDMIFHVAVKDKIPVFGGTSFASPYIFSLCR